MSGRRSGGAAAGAGGAAQAELPPMLMVLNPSDGNDLTTPSDAAARSLTIATRDVTAGEEIFVTYGPKYWMNKLRRRNDRIGQVLAGFL